MPLYSIRRQVGKISEQDLDASAFRAIVCAFQFEGLKWRHSYWDRQSGELNCIYEAQGPEQIEDHSRVSRISCDSISEVSELNPEPYIHG